jgi:hypothetical protein
LLGVGWTLGQALLLAAVAAGDRRPGRLLWAVILVEAGVVAAVLHHSPSQILLACLITVTVYVTGAALLHTRPHPATQPPGPAGPLPPGPAGPLPPGPAAPLPPGPAAPLPPGPAGPAGPQPPGFELAG